jgi:hypothetical protein
VHTQKRGFGRNDALFPGHKSDRAFAHALDAALIDLARQKPER